MAYPGIGPVDVPASFTVWAASDVHGQLAAFDRLLARAGLTDGADAWVAPAGSALVVTGDLVDRGRIRSAGPAARRAAVAGPGPRRARRAARGQPRGPGPRRAGRRAHHRGGVLHVRGRGEPALGRDGARRVGGRGGGASCRPGRRAGTRVPGRDGVVRAVRALGDVLLVHAGPVPWLDLTAFEAGAERLWIRQAFFESPDPFPDAPCWAAYREAGLGRVVFGHTSVTEPSLFHEGRALNLDTWKGGVVTLAGLAPGRPFAEATFLQEAVAPRAVADTPVSPERVLEIDAAMPAVVKAWWATLPR